MRDPSELISAYFDDSLADGEWEELRAWLAGDPERLRQFARESVIHSRLRDVLVQHDMRGIVFNELFGDAIDPDHIASLLDEEEAATLRRERDAAERARREAMAAVRREELLDRSLMRIEEPRIPRSIVYASLAAAAVLLLLAGRLIGPPASPSAGPVTVAAADPAPVDPGPVEPPVIAEIVHTFDAIWRSADGAIAAGAKLPARTLVLERGVAEVKFSAGATIIVEGPAELELITAERARLVSGRVVVHVPQQSLGFTLRSNLATFIDLGTEFGVQVDSAGQPSIHVLDGEVALVSGNKGETPSRTLQRGVASVVTVDGSIQDIPFDESQFLRRVPASEYELAVLKSRPLAYWRLNQADADATMTSEGRLSVATFVHAGVTTADNLADDGTGAGPARAASFAGNHDGIEVTGDAALGLVSNCTYEAWVQPGNAPTGPQRIFSTFARPRSGMAIGVVDGRWYNLPETELKFHLTVYGVYDCVSKSPIHVGEWVHVAATIDAAGVPTLFVNGAPVDRLFRPLGAAANAAADNAQTAAWSSEGPTPVGRTTAGQGRIGRNPVGADGQISPERFQGQISNVAVYDRVLGAKEIQQHFDATRKVITRQSGEQQ